MPRPPTSDRRPPPEAIQAGITPMFRQWLEAKRQHPDAILLFRMGDFFEVFGDDAVTCARLLDLTLTSRDKDKGDDAVPMAGVPHHAVRGYVNRLLELGHKVAICDQVEDPRKAKGLVRREVTEVVTPGLVTDPDSLDARAGNYLLAVAPAGGRVGLAWIDISTGEFKASEVAGERALAAELDRIGPREILLPDDVEETAPAPRLAAARKVLVGRLPRHAFDAADARRDLAERLGVADLAGFGLGDAPHAVSAAGAILHYLRQNRADRLAHVTGIERHDVSRSMVLDEATRRNLELFRTVHEGRRQGSLIALLDASVTPMGGRVLRGWLASPLLAPDEIAARLDAVDLLVREPELRRSLRDRLKEVSDVERLGGRISAGTATPRDLQALRASLGQVPALNTLLSRSDARALPPFAPIEPLRALAARIQRTLVDEPPASHRDGGIVRPGFHRELDELVDLSREGKGVIARLEADEKRRTGIPTLKIRYNRVFGYYIEVTNANKAMVPDRYIRKQTLANAERYYTPDLKEFEARVLGAEERRNQLEEELFLELRAEVATHAPRITEIARRVAVVDALAALADVAARHDYVRPTVDDSGHIVVRDGRHPVIERMGLGERFVPNDVVLDDGQRFLILTGPNMAGKSTVMRQVALIAILAQMGSFVPASEARIGVCDRVFTRVGASDDIASGHSTFMVEMSETANILRNATSRSLVILDEIGRGTSTFDGLSIAWAVAEHLHDRVGCRALFATHYHELVELADTRDRVRNYNISVAEWGDRVIFLRKLKEGGASRSYGIQVARLAGLPTEVLERAREVLANLERDSLDEVGGPRFARGRGEARRSASQLDLFGSRADLLRRELERMRPDEMTPMQALAALSELRRAAGIEG
ncbi:DNA mismatch repair protein MutS [Myxococcota bacterium]|nr:DNA mismatch repair protein MutS [Myxococcota bacterium]